ncbi:M35 family metallo-endopeptidase [Paraburkholderia phenoliruptrix]|uniref:M35 family metallo-endopeptidase n=1 Tax=Paraburkholderia phenoliruptrix TaxID=252970 RepID=A0ABV3WI08_9BURK|nr:M35 family metallo-endopeptidase [Paraburkholderia phenoliruptrix]MDR6391332.1 putative metallopeptidase [Paraburkholderia phenoliruptrix]
MSEGTEWVTVHDSAVTNADPDSMVRVTINTDRICPNMTNRQFADVVTRARDAGVALIKDRIAGVGRWDKNEQARARIYFARADEEIRTTLAEGLPRLLAAMQELVAEKVVRWDSNANKMLKCAIVPDNGANRAGVCKPDSDRRVIAIYSKFCSDSNGELFHASKVKVLIHECTHYTDTFNSEDLMYGDTEAGMSAFAMRNPISAIRNADSITGYIATFDRVVIK